MTEPVVSAGVVVVRRVDDQWRVLLLRCFKYWDFPKGLIDSGESPLEAARREALEEASLGDLDFAWGERSIATEPYGREKKVARYFLARTATAHIVLPVSAELGAPEHHGWRWLEWEAAEKLLVPRLKRVLGWARSNVEPRAT